MSKTPLDKIIALHVIALILFSTTIVNSGFSQNLIKDFNLSSSNVKVCKAEVNRTFANDNTESVHYYFDNDTEISPYTVEYKYVQVNHNEHIELPLKSFLADLDMYFDNGVSIESVGVDKVVTNNTLEIGQSLETANATYEIKAGSIQLVTYEVEMKNRKVIGEEMFQVEGGNRIAYIIESKLTLSKIQNDGTEFSNTQELVYDWFVPEFGIVKRQRTSLDNGSIASEAIVTETQF